MYIKLGSINLQYYQETNDWIILGEVLDSSMSFEKPILVRTTNELDIWFGKDFKDYSYIQELLNMGVVMYLYKPVSYKTIGGNNYIDLDEYTVNDNIWLRDVEIEWVSKVVKRPEDYKFKYNTGDEIKIIGLKENSSGELGITEDVGDRKFCTDEIVRIELLNPINQISKIYESPIKFHIYNSEDYWIYYEGEIIDTELLPQNLNLTSISENNRDTLIVSKPDPDNILKFTYLDYNSETGEFGIYQNKDIVDELMNPDSNYLSEIDMEKVAEGYQTLMFSIVRDSITSGDYFVIPNANHGTDISKWKLLYSGNYLDIPEEIRSMFSGRSISIRSFDNLISEIISQGYNVITRNNKYYLYSRTIIPVTDFYNSVNIKINPETKITEAVLSRIIDIGIEAVSKTIGKSSEFEDDLIKLTIEKKDETYRAVISRYTYSEVFEGSLKFIPGELRLDNLISQQSKLIRCNFYGDELRIGTYYLRGAQVEETNPDMFLYSLKNMLSIEHNDPVYPDYFLIPDKYKYTSNIITENIYPAFLSYSKEVNCQFLIENKSSDELFRIVEVSELPETLEPDTYYKVDNLYYDSEGYVVTDPFFNEVVSWGGDFVFNLTDDKENRLVYFFKHMTYKYEDRPGYFAYLRGLLIGEFSVSIKDVLYKNPTKDAFIEYSSIEDSLRNYKTNYLVCDNQSYFYKEYQDGKDYITTGWTRFIAGKIFRELQKNSGEILGQQLLGVIRSKISDLMYSIERGFSIVRTIEITEFEPYNNGQSLKITIDTVMNDLVKNDVSLDITVNYNNNIYGTIS